MHVDLNELGLASYNELIRLNLIEKKDKEFLTNEEIYNINQIIYNKLGDTLLKEVFQYKDGKLSHIEYKFNKIGAFTQLILIFALCYVNDMDLNNYFNLSIK